MVIAEQRFFHIDAHHHFASVAAITIGENLGHPCASPFYLASKTL
jgi:hypothetical protein